MINEDVKIKQIQEIITKIDKLIFKFNLAHLKTVYEKSGP